MSKLDKWPEMEFIEFKTPEDSLKAKELFEKYEKRVEELERDVFTYQLREKAQFEVIEQCHDIRDDLVAKLQSARELAEMANKYINMYPSRGKLGKQLKDKAREFLEKLK